MAIDISGKQAGIRYVEGPVGGRALAEFQQGAQPAVGLGGADAAARGDCADVCVGGGAGSGVCGVVRRCGLSLCRGCDARRVIVTKCARELQI